MPQRIGAPYMEWAKARPTPRFDLATSNVLACSIDDLHGAREALTLAGQNDNGYAPLLDAIAARYSVSPDQVAVASGTSGANFQVCAALLQPGDDVLVERPGYDPLLGVPRLLGARVIRFDREFAAGYALDPDRVRQAMTPQTRLIMITSPHNPSGAIADRVALQEIGRIATSAGAHVLVDEVYLDAGRASQGSAAPAAAFGEPFISTSSLTKSYGLSGLRCGWTLSSEATAERIRRARDLIDGSGSIATERLSVLAFAQLDRLMSRALDLLAVNGRILRDFLGSRRDLEWFDPPGGTVVFPRIRGISDSSEFASRLLSTRETAVVPGRFFEAPAHVRIGVGTTTEGLRGGLAAMGAALDAREY